MRAVIMFLIFTPYFIVESISGLGILLHIWDEQIAYLCSCWIIHFIESSRLASTGTQKIFLFVCNLFH